MVARVETRTLLFQDAFNELYAVFIAANAFNATGYARWLGNTADVLFGKLGEEPAVRFAVDPIEATIADDLTIARIFGDHHDQTLAEVLSPSRNVAATPTEPQPQAQG